MNSRETTTALLNHFAEQTDSPPLALDDRNECGELVDGKIPILFYLDEAESKLVATTVIGSLPPGNAEASAALLHEMLCGNYCWALTADGTLAIDPATGIATLAHITQVDREVAPADWAGAIAELLTSAEYWIDRIEAPDIEDEHEGIRI